METSPLTLDSIKQTEWETIINECEHKESWWYAFAFNDSAFDELANGNATAKSCYSLLAVITAPRLQLDDPRHPFIPTNDLDMLGQAEFELLKDLLPQVRDPEMRARIADILWVKAGFYEGAKAAIPAYLESAERLENGKTSFQSVERTERAMQIALMIRSADSQSEVVRHIEGLIDRTDGSGHMMLVRLMNLLQERNIPNRAKYALLSQKRAEYAEQSNEWFVAHEYWLAKARWHALHGDVDGEQEAKAAAAATFERAAEMHLGMSPPSHMAAAHHLKSAILEYRGLPGMRDKVYELRIRLVQCERHIPDEMFSFPMEGKLDTQPWHDQARDAVRGRPFPDTLRVLASLFHPPAMDSLLESAKKNAEDSPLWSFLHRSIINDDGRTIGYIPSSSSDDQSQAQTALEAAMFEIAPYGRFERVVLILQPALHQIVNEHIVRAGDLVPILAQSAFVPRRRIRIIAKGIHAGLTGDFITALHLLIPQIENSLRYILEMRGAPVSGINSEGIEDWYLLKALLQLPEASDFFGNDLIFDMRGLLSERHGSNTRNLMAHGLMDDDDFDKIDAQYIWWLALHLCFLVIRVPELASGAIDETQDTEETNRSEPS